MKNTILLHRTLSVMVEKEQHALSDAYVGAAMRNIERLGFTFSAELIAALRTLSETSFIAFYQQTVTDLRKMVGDNVTYTPFYPNFPEQVKEMPELTLYINAILHYLTLEKPNFEVKERFPLIENVNVKVITLAEEEAFEGLMKRLFNSATSLSPFDKEDILTVIQGDDNCMQYVPSVLPHKENMAFIVAALLTHGRIAVKDATHLLRTATDVLRLAVGLSGGDVSLAQPCRFRSFTRHERRFLLGVLEGLKGVEEDMVRYRERWVRLGEKVHPREYASRFPKANEAFGKLRNGVSIETFGTKVEAALKGQDVYAAIRLLHSRPGEFARRLDHLLRMAVSHPSATEDVLAGFRQTAAQLTTPVLLQLMAHFKGRDRERPLRAFFPKGNVAKVYSLEASQPALPTEVCCEVVAICEKVLKGQFASLPDLGHVYIDEQLQNFIVPFSQRSASKALHTVVRGSRLNIPDGDTLRFFLWWKEGVVKGAHTGRVDIDLSAVFFDENWKYLDVVSYYELKADHLEAYHSGDITSAPNGASEFIDIDIPSAQKNGCRYVMMALNSFSHQAYKDLPECYAGWMTRNEPNSGEIYEPSTVTNKLDVTTDSTIAVPVLFDLVERKAVWCDLSLTQTLDYHNNVQNNKSTMAIVGEAMASLQKPNLYELFRLHAEARGTVVSSPDEADITFAESGDVTPYHIESIMSDYLG